jgi:hypothetical protein
MTERCKGCDRADKYIGGEGWCDSCWKIVWPTWRRMQRLESLLKRHAGMTLEDDNG